MNIFPAGQLANISTLALAAGGLSPQDLDGEATESLGGKRRQPAGPPVTATRNSAQAYVEGGESFPAISILDPNIGVQVGSYGTGAKPIVASVGVGNANRGCGSTAEDQPAEYNGQRRYAEGQYPEDRQPQEHERLRSHYGEQHLEVEH